MLSDLQHHSAVPVGGIHGNHVSSLTSPLLLVPSHHYNNSNNNKNYPQYVTEYFPTTAPRYDSQYSLHEDVANFLNCVRLALTNPEASLDDHVLRNCIGFIRNFPIVDGITEHIWGGAFGIENVDSQQKMLLWLQGLQQRIEAATAKNLDFAAAAFGPCEEARRDRGVSGISDVEAVRSDLAWWLQQHEELEARLKVQKEYLKRLKETTMLTTATTNNNNRDGDSNSDPLQSVFHRANDLQSMYLAKSTSNIHHNPYSLAEDIATLSRSISEQKAKDINNNNQSRGNSSRSESTNNTQKPKSMKDKQLDHLSQELLALQAATYRTRSIAETREKLVGCVLSLGSEDYGEKKYVRSVTNPNRFS
jgi:hypothetical protein